MRVILASASPRRAELLQAAGIRFEVSVVEVDERFQDDERPERAVARVAELKARAAAARHPADIVLGADTTVVIDGDALGKPLDEADAAQMLRRLSGHTHTVLTGVCLCAPDRCLVHVESTQVQMAPLSEAEIAWYIATGEASDKAGAYAVQGLASRFIGEIRGSYSNVVGLPVAAVYQLLRALGCDTLDLGKGP